MKKGAKKKESKKMKRFEVTFKDMFEAESEEECYDAVLTYLQDCVRNGDVTGFEFVELE